MYYDLFIYYASGKFVPSCTILMQKIIFRFLWNPDI